MPLAEHSAESLKHSRERRERSGMVRTMRKAIVLLGLAFSGCSLGDPFHRPDMPLPESWRTPLETREGIDRHLWWQSFADPALSAALDAALRGNEDLLSSTAAVQAYAARYEAAYANELPRVDVTGSVQRTRRSLGSFTSGLLQAARTTNSSSISLQASWELDLWGKLKNMTEAARAQLLAQESTRQGAVLSLISTTASAYVRLRQADRLREVSLETVKSRMEALKLTRARYAGGMTSELDVRQAESELATAQTTVPRFQRAVAENENMLRMLQGLMPGDVERGRTVQELAAVTGVPSEIPARLLEERPDIRAAEERLRASHAEIAVARAAYFPDVSLSAAFGFASADLDTWIDGRSRTWSVGPSLAGPVLSAGRIAHQVEAANADQEQALHLYRQTILQAIREVEDALVGFKTAREELDNRTKQLASLRAYHLLATTRYDAGQSSYLDVLDAQRALFQGELDLAQSQGDVALARIQLFRTLGGEWIEEKRHTASE